ncbi:erythromycin esterase family protein [Streptomyces sp. NPDC008121]|uniref:erythromycin esterase family protein n=1 Tax=Streptomyces sp. NPDC008121 TaxID=3364809 RepID=UPI0036EB0B24
MSLRKEPRRRHLLALMAASASGLLMPEATAAPRGPAPGGAGADGLVDALERAAHPLRSTDPGVGTADLHALGAMIGDAEVVGLGEATHGSHEFFAMKERVFRYLVEERGFTTFALEMSWPAGLLIDEYVQGGPGGAREIVLDALAGTPWARQEFVSLIAWMRGHNQRHPDRTVHFMGDDLGGPKLGDRIFERVVSSVRTAAPRILTRLVDLYAGLRPFDDFYGYLHKPVEERRRNAALAQEALDLVAGRRHSPDDPYAWTVQHARNIAQTFAFATIDLADPATVPPAQRLRDQAMADNVLWWKERTKGRILLSAHNAHVGYRATDPVTYARTQGVALRERLGRRYAAIGFTFAGGTFLVKDASGGAAWTPVSVPPATPGMNEHTLDRVRYRDFYVDLRTVRAPARAWLAGARPVYDAGQVFTPDPLPELALGTAYDVLVHLHRVRAATPLARN